MDQSKRKELVLLVGKKLRVDDLQNAVNQFGESRLFNLAVSKRNFLKLSTIIGITGIISIFNGCAATPDFNELADGEKVTYPKLLGKKIQSPEHYGLDGCYTGLWAGGTYLGSNGPKDVLNRYQRDFGKDLTFIFIDYKYHTNITLGIGHAKEVYEAGDCGLIPFISFDGRDIFNEKRNILNDLIKGDFDNNILLSANKLRTYGDQYGGFFIRTLREMNMKNAGSSWPPYGGSPRKFKKAWAHIWEIFESEGTNQYATWVFSPYVGRIGGRAHYPAHSMDPYYPGPEMVDWIGLNSINHGSQWYGEDQSFTKLFKAGHNHCVKKYPNHPILLIAATDANPSWYQSMFNDFHIFQGVKGISFWSQRWSHYLTKNMDSRIDATHEVLAEYKKGISDKLFLGKVNYHNV